MLTALCCKQVAKELINLIEGVQRRATNFGLSRLTTRRVRSDLIQTFKIINDKVDKSLFFEIDSSGRRGHSSKLFKNVADLTLGNMHLVIALLTNGIL